MLRRDPFRDALRGAAEVLGREPDRETLALTRQVFGFGGVLGVSRSGRGRLFALGDVPVGGVFELASVTKPFTAALAAGLVRQGRLTWDTPLRRLGGPLRSLPPHFTAFSLATHTAGLPLHPARAALTTFTRFHDPYGGMTAQAVLGSARRWARSARPPRFSYSNLGVGTLALALACAAGEELSADGYGRALERHVLAPLDLSGLTLRPHAGTLVTPRGTLSSAEVTGFGELAGAGGLSGPAGALLAFGQAHLGGQIGDHWRHAIRPPGLLPPYAGVAPGWFHGEAPGSPAVWHDGVARGTRTSLGLHEASGTVVTILARGGLPVLGHRAAVPGLMLKLLGAQAQRRPFSPA